MNKTYSTKSNAKAAAKMAGELNPVLSEAEGRWTWAPAAGEVTVAYLGTLGRNVTIPDRDDDESTVQEFAPPAFLQNDRSVQPVAAMAAVAEEPPADKALTREDAIEVGFRAYLGADEHGDTLIRWMLGAAYDAGVAAAISPDPRRGGKVAKPRGGGPTKREIAAGLLQRPEGTTTREILDATGWPAVSIPAIAKASGLTLRQEREGKVTRYYGAAA
jgi:hypothetical protein